MKSSKKINILFITEFFPFDDQLQFSGGVEAHNFYLLRELVKKHQVTVICRGSRKQKQRNSWGIKIIRVGGSADRIDTNFATFPNRFLFIIQSFIAGLKLDFDLVQGNNFVSYPSAFLLGFWKKKPTIAWYPDVFVGDWISLVGKFSGMFGEVAERLSLNFPWSQIVSLSDSTTEKLLKQKIDLQKITTIHGGVDFNYFSQIKSRKENVFTICCIARLVSYKRVDLLLKATQILKRRKVNFKVEIIGQGPEDFSLKLLAQNLKIEEMVSFHPNLSREQLAKKLKSAHLFCLPSEQEGFGLVVMEAASSKIPYVVSNIKVFKEITKNGQGGLLFRKGDAKDLANKINRLMKDKSLYQKLALESFQLAQLYRWEQIAQQFEEVYKKVLVKPMTILMLVDAWFPLVGGGQIHAWELAKQIANQGHKVIIYTRNLGDWNESATGSRPVASSHSSALRRNDKTYPGVEVIRVGHFKEFANIFGRLEYLLLALVYSLRAKYDIWHAHAFSPGLLTPFVEFFRIEPTVFTAHGQGMQIAGLGTSGKFLEDLVFYKMPYDGEITVAKKTFTQKPIAKKVKVIPNGVNIPDWIGAQRKRKEPKHLLFVGRVVYDKGVDLLIEAFAKTKGFDLTIVGDGNQLTKLKQQAKSLKIKFTGRLEGEKLVQQFKEADLLVMPSRVEGMPLRLLEAWAAKLPVIATRTGDNEVYIKDRVNGFLADIEAGSIQKAIEKARKSDLQKISENGWVDVQKFTWEEIAQQTIKVYQEVLDENSQN